METLEERIKEQEIRLERYKEAIKLRRKYKWGSRRIGKFLKMPVPTVSDWIYRNLTPERIKIYKPQITSELCYLAGVIAGDGHLDKEGSTLKITNGRKDFLISIRKIFEKTFKCYVKIEDNGTFYDLYISRSGIVYIFNKMFKIPLGKKADKIFIPNLILNTEFRYDFLRGLYDTDGSICDYKHHISLYTKSKKLIRQVKNILKDIGIKKTYLMEIHGYGSVYRLFFLGIDNLILFKDKIGFSKFEKALKMEKSVIRKVNSNLKEKILDYLEKYPNSDRFQIASAIKAHPVSVHKNLRKLTKDNKILFFRKSPYIIDGRFSGSYKATYVIRK